MQTRDRRLSALAEMSERLQSFLAAKAIELQAGVAELDSDKTVSHAHVLHCEVRLVSPGIRHLISARRVYCQRLGTVPCRIPHSTGTPGSNCSLTSSYFIGLDIRNSAGLPLFWKTYSPDLTPEINVEIHLDSVLVGVACTSRCCRQIGKVNTSPLVAGFASDDRTRVCRRRLRLRVSR